MKFWVPVIWVAVLGSLYSQKLHVRSPQRLSVFNTLERGGGVLMFLEFCRPHGPLSSLLVYELELGQCSFSKQPPWRATLAVVWLLSIM